jgi:hypothetical protein
MHKSTNAGETESKMFELKTLSNRASPLKGYGAPAVNGPAASRKAESGITLWAIKVLDSAGALDWVEDTISGALPK